LYLTILQEKRNISLPMCFYKTGETSRLISSSTKFLPGTYQTKDEDEWLDELP
jgi:hypothetical protein